MEILLLFNKLFGRGKSFHTATLPANEIVDPFTKHDWVEDGFTGQLFIPESFGATQRFTTKTPLSLDTVYWVYRLHKPQSVQTSNFLLSQFHQEKQKAIIWAHIASKHLLFHRCVAPILDPGAFVTPKYYIAKENIWFWNIQLTSSYFESQHSGTVHRSPSLRKTLKKINKTWT